MKATKEAAVEATGQEMVRMDPQAMILAAVEKGAPVEALEKLVALAERVQANRARSAWYDAMAQFQQEAPRVLKSKKANMGRFSFTYAPLDELLGAVQPVMGPLGLSISFRLLEATGQAVTYVARISHAMGHHEDSGPVTIPITQGGAVAEGTGANPAQRVGIAHSYAKRYAALAILGIAPEDDEAAAPAGPTVARPARASAPPQEAPEPGSDDGPEPDGNVWTGKVKEVKQRTGTKKDGSPWTLYVIVGADGMELGTFSQSLADFATESIGSIVEVKWTPTPKGGRNAISIEPLDV